MDDTSHFFSRKESFDHSTPQDTEIAYYLQNSQPGDRTLIDILVDSYAIDIEWLIEILLADRLGSTPSTGDIFDCSVHTFTHAINHCNQFWGEATVRNWLYAQAISVTRSHAHNKAIKLPANRAVDKLKVSGDDTDHHRDPGESFRNLLRSLSEKQYLSLILRTVIGIPTVDIAGILGVSVQVVHQWLYSIRHELLDKDRFRNKKLKQEYPQDEDHKISRSRIQLRLDGLIEQNSKEAILLREHLLQCPECQAYDDGLERSWQQLASNLRERLPLRGNSNSDLEQLKLSIHDKLTVTPRSSRIFNPLRIVVWITLLFMVFASGTWALMRITPERGEFPATPTPTERFLPTPIVPIESSIIQNGNIEEPNPAVYAFGSKISADGRWIVYFSNVDILEDGEIKDEFDIILYDTHSRTLERIGEQIQPIDGMVSTQLDISKDGRWIVFTGAADAIDDGDEPCQSIMDDKCSDVLLYDRNNASLSRLTHGFDGHFANGYSIMPTISDNGRWIVFWSIARNLVEAEAEVCKGDGQNTFCAELYVYDRITREIDQIKIGKSPGYFPPANISDDGRWLLVTIYKSDLIADKVGLKDEGDVFIYDREEDVFVPVDVTPDGSLGNGISSYANMTPDGRYVSFYSTSDNLVALDDNGFGDVFLFDRSEKKIELISIATDGTPADDERVINIGISSSEISISDDARYIVYASAATNLDPSSPGTCKTSEDFPCVSIFVHDSDTGYTHKLEVPRENHIALMPDISGNGRLISYIDLTFPCNNNSGICSDLRLYDREREWTSEITRNLFSGSDSPWEIDPVIELAPKSATDIEFSPDGESFALAGAGSHLEVYSSTDGRQLFNLEGNKSEYIRVATYSPGGEYIAGGTTDGTVNIWRTSDGSLAYLLDNHPGRIIDLKFSDDGEYLYVATPRTVWVWYISERKFTREYTIDYLNGFVEDVDISPSNELLAVVPTKEPYVWIQRLPGGDVIHRLGGNGGKLSSVIFSPDGDYLLTQYKDGLTQLWLMEVDAMGSVLPKLIKEIVLSGSSGRVVFSPDGKYVAVGSFYGGLWIWDVSNDRKQLMLGLNDISNISDVDFSASGRLLVAATREGVFIWRSKLGVEDFVYFRQLASDEFIQIPNRRRPLREAKIDLGLDKIVVDDLNYYQADDLLAYDVYTPFKLPANITYARTSIRSDGSVISDYRVDDLLSGEQAANLYFLQQPIDGNIRPFWVGSSSVVEQVEFNNRSAEYVKGDWSDIFAQTLDEQSSQGSQNLYYTWSSESDVQQLRWRNLGQLFSLVYIPRQNFDHVVVTATKELGGGKFRQPMISKYDLVNIASGISSLQNSSKTQQILISYTVKPGDTCTSIAYRYDTTIDNLIRLNNLTDHCDVIFIGQTLQVPLPDERLPIAKADLDCDGNNEHLGYIPVPGFLDANISYGYVLDMLSEIGLYVTAWQYTIADMGAEYMVRPQLLTVDDCKQLLAVHVMPIDAGSESELKVFEWDGKDMKIVFTADGWLQTGTSDGVGNIVLTTLELEYIPGTSNCNRTNVTYSWNGETFKETASTTEQNSSCGLK